MPLHPLAEVFGFAHHNHTERAERYRDQTLCPYNNKVPSCTKNSVENPLGVCSVYENEQPVITCPIRFREDWLILTDAASFFFEPGTQYTSVAEVRLDDAEGKSAGNIDFVLVALDEKGEIKDFGALEVQAVYISGNVTKPFEKYMGDRLDPNFSWKGSVRPDYLSSSKKRLIPQLISKGEILRHWKKKVAVAIQDSFYETLPSFPTVPKSEADLAWYIYSLPFDETTGNYRLNRENVFYTDSQSVLAHITSFRAGDMSKFIERLQNKLDNERTDTPPINLTLFDEPTEE